MSSEIHSFNRFSSLLQMEILRRCASNTRAISRVFRVLLYSTPANESLQSRILRAIDLRVPVVPVLEEWIEEGRSLKEQEVHKLMREIRSYKQYSHALEICEWMKEKRYLEPLPGDVAVELDLISKVRGLEQAEKYFNDIPNSLRCGQAYGSLLNCYAQYQSLEKAEAIMLEMRDLGFLSTLSCNALLNLYYKLGMREKLDSLIQEMDEKGINWDRYTFCIQLNAYIAASDIESMEKLLMKLETNPPTDMEWNTYATAANGYLKAGMKEKATEMLKKAESFINSRWRRAGYEILLTLYAAMGNKAEVYRIWNLYKRIGRFYNTGYICMMSSLLKMDNIDGAEQVLEEWLPRNRFFDFWVPNMLIRAYCKKGLWEKAEKLVNRTIDMGKEPIGSTWVFLAAGYCQCNKMEKAVDAVKKALMAIKPRKPDPVALTACFEHLKGKGDVEEAEDLARLLVGHGYLSSYDSNRLVSYIKGEEPGFNTVAQILQVGQELNQGTDAVTNSKEEMLG